MNKAEIRKATKLLDPYTQRIETAILDTGGQCLTAHWTDGSQTLYYSLDSIDRDLADRDLADRDLADRDLAEDEIAKAEIRTAAISTLEAAIQRVEAETDLSRLAYGAGELHRAYSGGTPEHILPREEVEAAVEAAYIKEGFPLEIALGAPDAAIEALTQGRVTSLPGVASVVRLSPFGESAWPAHWVSVREGKVVGCTRLEGFAAIAEILLAGAAALRRDRERANTPASHPTAP